MFVDVDIHQAAGAVKTLSEFIFSEDVEISDVSSQFHRIAVHGRMATEVIAAAAGQNDFALGPGGCAEVMIDGTSCIVFRRDETGEVGLHLIVPYDKAAGVWEFLVAADHVVGEDKRRVRPIGWHAYNIARIEAGTPLMNIDFGPTNLPHETGVLRERVSFTKGCYLGQEIVARMESLGQPKQMLVGLKMRSDVLPIAGTNVFTKEGDALGPIVGTVTSSTLSPMLGATPIAFAMMKTAQAATGNVLVVTGDGRESEAVVGPLRFHEGGSGAAAAAVAARRSGAPATAPLEGQP
jgi:folate-binding protein YgfZ